MVFLEQRVARTLVTDPVLRDRGPHPGGAKAQADSVDLLLLESIDEVLTELLGRRVREAVYDYLERKCPIARNEIPRRLDDFFRLLNETFGKGSKTIGKVIAKTLYAKLGWEFVDMQSYEPIDYIETVRSRLEKELACRTTQT